MPAARDPGPDQRSAVARRRPLRRAFSGALRWLRPPRQLRPTRAGWSFFALTFGVGFAALNTGNNLLYLVLSHGDVLALQRVAAGIKFHDALVSYVLEIAAATRDHEAIAIGVSPRGAIALRRAAQARALLDGRDFCIPEDVSELAVDVLAHRITLDARTGHRTGAEESAWLLREILDRTSVPL